MLPDEQKHQALTAVRLKAYTALFGGEPLRTYRVEELVKKPGEYWIDVVVYGLDTKTGKIEVAVTNGMSDRRMVEKDHPERWARRELIQYFPKCTKQHAVRLYGMAWLPHFDHFLLDIDESVGKLNPQKETPWDNAFFLPPIIKSHREFEFEVDGDKTSFLWHIPISDEERAFKMKHGFEALIERMDAVKLPWIFDETNRPSLVD